MRQRALAIRHLVMLLLVFACGAGSAWGGAGWGDSTDLTGATIQVPTYYANSPSGIRIDPKGGGNINTGNPLRKFVDSLPGLGEATKNQLGQYIPIAVPDKAAYPGSDYYEIAIVEYKEQLHSDLPNPTTLRGYVQLETPANAGVSKHYQLFYPNGLPIKDLGGNNVFAVDMPHYLGPLISAERGTGVRIKYTNYLPTGHYDAGTKQRNGDLFLPVDETLMGAGMGPDGMSKYSQNRADIHLHGGDTPWISDGTPHQWITPAGEDTPFKKGVSFYNVPDMPDPGDGSGTLYYPNGDSGRLMFYHDHTAGLTRLNVYAGEAAGYLLSDPEERKLVTSGAIPADQIPLVIQDRTFVPLDVDKQDAKWDKDHWGQPGDLWYPHVYETNQDPNSFDGTNPVGRWDWGPWFWPVFPATDPLPTGAFGDVTTTPEAFGDTPVINGTAYPKVDVEPKAYRFRILNAANDRFLNLGLYVADPNVVTVDGRKNTEVTMVPFDASFAPGFPAYWGTPDARTGGVPDPSTAGPPIIQIGTEGGLLPAPAVIPSTPINYEYNRRSVTVLNVMEHGLFLGNAERADVVIDFSQYAGKTLILYNDAPAPVPAGDPRLDYYTGNPDFSAFGGAASTLAGFGPNTRTIMQINVKPNAAAAPFDLAKLQAELPVAYAASQPKPVVAQDPYNPAFGTNYTNTFAKIYTGSATQPNFTFVDGTTGQSITLPVQNKAIQELFDSRGRMNATLGVELPFTSALTQTTIPLGYIDPTTETLNDGETQIWKITHNGVDTHPVHFHLVNVQLINRVGWDGTVKPPNENEVGWKETVRMNPLEDVIVAVRSKRPVLPGFGLPVSKRLLDPTQPLNGTMNFTQVNPSNNQPASVKNVEADFGWEYVWHCHILGHEENDFMRPFVFRINETLPAAPTNVIATGATSLTWTDNSSNEIGFRIERADVNGGITGTFAAVGTALANATAYSDNTINPGQTYAYRIVAYNSIGDAASDPVTLTPVLGTPGAPGIGTATAGNGQATVTFTTPLSDGGSAILSYTVFSTPGGITATGNASPITVTGLVNGTTYTFRVVATNAIGTGPASAASNAVVPATVPDPPVIGTATAGVAQATVTFTPPIFNGGSAITSYTVTSNPAGITATGTSSPITVTGLTNGTAYSFRVAATNAIGTGTPSAPSNTVRPATVPDAPVSVTATAGNAQAAVSFSAPAFDGGSPITLYTVTSTPGNITATGTASPITVSGLTNGTAYTFTVTATNSAGTGPASTPSAAITPATLPGAPTIGTATAGNAQATVTFAAPSSDGGSPVVSYTVTSSPGGVTATGAASPIIVPGLNNGTSYTFTVAATNVAGTGASSAASNAVTPLAAPGAPSITSATAGNGTVSVAFNAPLSTGGTAIIMYTVTSSPGGFIATGTASPIVVSGLTNGTPYTFTVTATNAVGTGTASAPSAAVTPATVPGSPVIGTATWGNTEATVVFSAPISNGGSPVTSYTVTSSPGGITVSGAASPLVVTGLTNGTPYTFTVTATNAIGTGLPSAPSNIVTPATVPGAPQIVTVTATNGQALVTFNAPVSNGGSTITQYTATSSPGAFTATGTTSPITVTGLTNGVAYTFVVTATNIVGTGAASAVSGAVIPTATKPATPSGLVATLAPTSSNPPQVTLTWKDNATNEAGYVIQRATNSSFTTGLISFSLGMNATTYTDTSILPGIRYYYRVRAYNMIGTSAFSAAVSVLPRQTPVEPSNPAVVTTTRTAVTISWTDNASNETGFYVQRATTATGPWSRIAAVPASTATPPATVSYTNTGRTPGRTYWYRIQAYNADGTSAFTTPISATTLP